MSTKYFCSLEKRHYMQKMTKLILEDGTSIKKQRSVLLAQKEFYASLYKTRNVRILEKHRHTFLNKEDPFLTTLDPVLDPLNGELTLQECGQVLMRMQNGKSPGLDGCTVEFYKFLWKDLGKYLVNSLMYGYANKLLSVTQRQSMITCLPKDGKSKLYLKNWRPIYLLNVDYKIASTSVAQRVKNVLSHIIRQTQTGFVKNRYIGEEVRLVMDLIEKTECENIPAVLILLDLEKAIDSIEWSFIKLALEFFAFSNSMVRWFETLYSEISSCVKNNGHCSEFFPVERGVRQ